jgi:hypothetical protein
VSGGVSQLYPNEKGTCKQVAEKMKISRTNGLIKNDSGQLSKEHEGGFGMKLRSPKCSRWDK